MTTTEPVRLTRFSHGAGCACKLSPDDLRTVLGLVQGLEPAADPHLLVGMDTGALQATIQQILPNERGVKVSAAFDSVVLSGTVSDSEALVRITDLANAYVRGTEGAGGGQNGSAASRNARIVNMLEVGAPLGLKRVLQAAEHLLVLVEADDRAAGAGELGRGPAPARQFDHADVARVQVVNAAPRVEVQVHQLAELPVVAPQQTLAPLAGEVGDQVDGVDDA